MSGRLRPLAPFSALPGASEASACFRSATRAELARSWSRRELSQLVEALTLQLDAVAREADLRERGPAGRWLVHQADALGSALCLLALARSGGSAVMAPNAQPETLRRLAQGVRGALLDPGLLPASSGLPVIALQGLAGQAPAADRPIQPAARVAELQTSGTTGRGKAVSKEVRHLADEVAMLETCFGERLADASVFATVSSQHIYGLLFRVLWPLAAGRPFQSETLLLPQELVPKMRLRAPCALVTTPAHLAHMVAHPEFASLRTVCSAVFSSGAPLGPATRDAVEQQLGAPPIEILGSTETGGIAWRQGDEPFRAFPGVEIECAEDGRLAVVSRWVSSGDLRGPLRRRFVTGDRCELREPGRFALVGRADRVVKIGGKRLSLAAMEGELVHHGAVAEVALLALARGAEPRVHAVVVPSAEGRDRLAASGPGALSEALLAYLAARFDRVLLPRAWRFVGSLPRDAQGKLSQAALQEIFSRVTQPEIRDERREERALVRRLRVPTHLAHLEGHFPDRPVVPGVVALGWALDAARALLARELELCRVDVAKFPTPLRPGQELDLRVELDAQRRRIRFELREADAIFATGRASFRTEARP